MFFNLRLTRVSLSEQILSKFNKKYSKISFLQIGANDGISFDCLYSFVTQNKWKGVVVEPLEDFYKRLCLNYEFYSDVIPLNVAIHPTAKEFNLYRVDPKYYKFLPDWTQGIASINYDHLVKHNIEEYQIIIKSVLSVHLMDLIDQYNLFDIDYLQIDVEGFDAEIVNMINFSKLKPKLIKFEYKHLEQSKFKDILNLLKNQGYFFKKDSLDLFCYLKGVI